MKSQLLLAAAAAMSGANTGYASPNGSQGRVSGQFTLGKWSILKCEGNPTYRTGGTYRYRAPKPERAKFTREQRISTAKALAKGLV